MNYKYIGIATIFGFTAYNYMSRKRIHRDPYYDRSKKNQSIWMKIFASNPSGVDLLSAVAHGPLYPWQTNSVHPTSVGRNSYLPRQSTFASDSHVYTNENQFITPSYFNKWASDTPVNAVHKYQNPRSARSVFLNKLSSL